jgi:hypothetical protein
MTWIRSQKRWTKMYKGTRYYVSTRELGMPATEADSLLAANRWWEAKRAEIDGGRAAPAPGTDQAVAAILEAWAGQRLDGPEDASEAMLEIVRHIQTHGLPQGVAEAVLGPEKVAQLRAGADAVADAPAVPAEKTVGRLVEVWLANQMNLVRAGKVGLARANMNKVCLHHFLDWIGEHTPVASVDEMKWREFHSYLCGRLDQGVWGLSHCDRIFTVARRWVRFCWEMRLLELPRNLASMELSFTIPPQEIEIFTVEELAKLVSMTTGQSALHILLMLNCGFIGQDISDLRQDEVDWQAGVITRKRSKTRKEAGVPVVRYKLWHRTFKLLKEHRSADKEVVLLTNTGKRWIEEYHDGEYHRSDKVASNLKYWLKRSGVKHAPSCLRATAASKMGEHKHYKFYAQYFLGQSPRTIADKHYVRPSDAEFFKALEWLEGALGF